MARGEKLEAGGGAQQLRPSRDRESPRSTAKSGAGDLELADLEEPPNLPQCAP